jgi:hypothetical protein
MRKKNPIILTGARYGRWIILSHSPEHPDRWLCRCDCGQQRTVAGVALRNHRSQSCGCWRRARCLLPGQESALRLVEHRYRNRARRKGIPFTLTQSRFRELLSRPCAYCAAPPSILAGRTRKDGTRVHSPARIGTVDRLDSLRGYEDGNCVPACLSCNVAKRSRSPLAFQQLRIRQIAKALKQPPPPSTNQLFWNFLL